MSTEYLSFEEFRQRVGESEYQVRTALRVLKLVPQPTPGDMRRLVYPSDWVQKVKDYIASLRRP